MLSRPGSRRHFDVVDPSEGSVLATGDGLNAKDAQRLSTALDRALSQGRVEEHLRQLHNAAGAVDRQPCPLWRHRTAPRRGGSPLRLRPPRHDRRGRL